ncbi:hypothetical protein, partial [Sphingomonas sp. 37zxx]|uniref:hypothetical protein n=1 Tax=Sphingomonas sp. 37zxx TaxID=1550073 RepID=UPI0018CD58FB
YVEGLLEVPTFRSDFSLHRFWYGGNCGYALGTGSTRNIERLETSSLATGRGVSSNRINWGFVALARDALEQNGIARAKR